MVVWVWGRASCPVRGVWWLVSEPVSVDWLTALTGLYEYDVLGE